MHTMMPDDRGKKHRHKRIRPHDARQALANLNDVDASLLMLLLKLRYLRTDQVRAVIYPERDQMYVWQRLNTLQHRGLVDNLKIRQGASTIAYWCLDQLGLRVAEELLGIPEEERTTVAEHTVSAAFAQHYAEAGGIYVALFQSFSADSWRWYNQRRRYEYDRVAAPRGERPLWLSPDATIELDYGSPDQEGTWRRNGTWTYYLELDRSTMSHNVMTDKFQKYVKWFSKLIAKPFWTPLDLDHYILVVCPSAVRAQHLQQILDREVLPGRAVTADQALEILSGGLPTWWSDVLDKRSGRAERERQQREAVDAAARSWIQYERDLAAWKRQRSEWAQQKWEAQLIKMRDLQFYIDAYETPAPTPPTMAKPSEADLERTRRQM